jgi:Ca2+-binding RTX toxin-like protein
LQKATSPTTTTLPIGGRTATIVGTHGSDNILGTTADDAIVTLGGGDTVRTQGGDDFICGGPDDDLLFGDEGNDHINGGGGDDNANCGDGDEGLSGDMLGGDPGTDDLRGGNGDDTANGNYSDDNIFGDAGYDMLSGNDGDDSILVVKTTTIYMVVLTQTAVMLDQALICAIRSRSKIFVKIDTTISSIIKPGNRSYSHACPLDSLSVKLSLWLSTYRRHALREEHMAE